MATCKTEGIVVARLDFSETSQVVSFYTRDHGLVRVLAKGSKRARSMSEGALDLLAAGELLFIEKRADQLAILTAFHQRENFSGVRRDLRRFHLGLWICELLSRLTNVADPNPEVYDLAWAMLTRVASGGADPLHRSAFEARLIAALGYTPRTDRCVRCERPVAAADGATAWWVSPQAGGAVCDLCAARTPDRLAASIGTLGLLGNLAAGRTPPLERLRVAPAVQEQLTRILTTTLCHLMGREPRMLRFLEGRP